MLKTITVAELRSGNILVSGQQRFVITRRHVHGLTTTLTLSNVDNVLDLSEITVHNDLACAIVTASA